MTWTLKEERKKKHTYIDIFTLNLSKTLPLLAALKFTVWTENTRISACSCSSVTALNFYFSLQLFLEFPPSALIAGSFHTDTL